MSRKKPNLSEQSKKPSFRLPAPYDTKLLKKSQLAGLTPSKYAQLAVMALTDHGLLDLPRTMDLILEELQELRSEQNQFRQAFNDALQDSDS